MSVQIVFKNAKRSPATDEKVYSKVRHLQKYFIKHPKVKWNCTKSTDGDYYTVDVYVHNYNQHFSAHAEGDNMYKCFDDVEDKLAKQLERHYARVTEPHKKAA